MKPSDSQLDDTCLLINSDGVIMDARDAACPALGWAREELVNKGMSELLEYGADLLMNQLRELQAGATAESSFTVSTLVRRKDQTHFPATAIVRPMPELDCFVVGFDDLPTDAAVATESVTAVKSNDDQSIPPAPEPIAPEPPAEIPVAFARDVEPENGNAKSNGNGHPPRFRNIFLSEPPRPEAKAEANHSNGKGDLAAQLETERQERRRLEARVLSLNDQLQQLHVQLKSSLESENVYQKRVSECEEAVRKSEASKTAAETALHEQQQQRERVEHEFAEFKSAHARSNEERAGWEAEWLAKLESSLTGLHESDVRFAHEIATRRGIQDKLQALQQDFLARPEQSQATIESAPDGELAEAAQAA
jgi:PAS domain S-box-containing protein